MKAKDFAIGILIEDYKSGLRTKTETTAEILALFNVVGQSEHYCDCGLEQSCRRQDNKIMCNTCNKEAR